MFEIGSSLRDSRMRQKLDLAQVERATRIRARYLMALEEDRFEALPAPAYAKGFLRTYADYLGLDAQRFVDEFNARFAPADETLPVAPPRIRRRRSGIDLRPLVLPAVVLLGLLGWRLATSGGHQGVFLPPAPTTHAVKPATPPTTTRAATSKPRVAKIILTAARGGCWLSVRLGSDTGRLLYEATLQQGQSARFSAPRVWIRLGAPWNLDATLNGKSVRLPGALGNVIVTPTGLRSA
jgi:cytoskeleton protein RodZ